MVRPSSGLDPPESSRSLSFAVAAVPAPVSDKAIAVANDVSPCLRPIETAALLSGQLDSLSRLQLDSVIKLVYILPWVRREEDKTTYAGERVHVAKENQIALDTGIVFVKTYSLQRRCHQMTHLIILWLILSRVQAVEEYASPQMNP